MGRSNTSERGKEKQRGAKQRSSLRKSLTTFDTKRCEIDDQARFDALHDCLGSVRILGGYCRLSFASACSTISYCRTDTKTKPPLKGTIR